MNPKRVCVTIISTILLILFMPVTGSAYEMGQFGAGGYVGYAIPFGWLADRLDGGITVGAYATYSLDNLVPNLHSRVNINYMSMEGEYSRYWDYTFRDFSIYVNGLYYFPLDFPVKLYGMAGIGIDFVRIDWDYYDGNSRDSYDDTDLGEGLQLGVGGEFEITADFSMITELQFHTSSFAGGAGFGDFVHKIIVGGTYYLPF